MVASRRTLGAMVGACVLMAVVACGDGGEQRSFGSSKIEAVPTNVSGSGTTSGIGAGAVLSPGGGGGPASGASPTPTQTPTATPAPSK